MIFEIQLDFEFLISLSSIIIFCEAVCGNFHSVENSTAPPPKVLYKILIIRMREWWFRAEARIFMVGGCSCVIMKYYEVCGWAFMGFPMHIGAVSSWTFGGVWNICVFRYISGRFRFEPFKEFYIYFIYRTSKIYKYIYL